MLVSVAAGAAGVAGVVDAAVVAGGGAALLSLPPPPHPAAAIARAEASATRTPLAHLRRCRPTACWLSLTGSTSRVRVADAYAEAYAGAMADPGFLAKRLGRNSACERPARARPSHAGTDGWPVSVRVGIGLGPFGDDDLSPGGFLRQVERVEELGYDSIWLSDSATMAGPAPLVALAAAAARTTRLKLGTSVLVAPARNPVVLAKELATVDALSGGRLLPAFGLGIDAEPEAGAIGVARSERAARTQEAIEIVRLLWQGTPVT